jgi:hypothetical protein
MRRLTPILALLAVALVAATAIASTRTKLTRSLARSGEVTGFDAGKPKTATTARSYLVKTGESGATLKRDVKRLTKERFAAGATERLSPAPGSAADAAGISWAIRFGSSRGAKHEKAFFLNDARTPRSGMHVRFFDIPGLPGARGFSFTDNDPQTTGGAANVVWTRSSCAFLVGDFQPNSGSRGNDGPIVDPVIAGAKAIVKRTRGACPAR